MVFPGPSRLVPLGAHFVLHAAAFFLAWATGASPGDPAAYVLWLVPLGFLAATWIALRPLRPVPSALVLFAWCLAVQLVLIPPGFSDSFRLL